MPFVIGENIGPYRLVEQLGQGGMATVFKAYHPELDRYVAIKALHPAFAEDDTFLARFQREARVVAKLEHPNIVPIYDYSQYENRPYLVMKYIEGETLKARISNGMIPVEESLQIIETIGNALQYAHDKGVLHRDMKPSNVLISKDNQIYLTDFGLARMAQSSDNTLTTDMMIGTPQYISPEQALAKQDLDSRTDIYSLGVMIYELLVGKVPFSADTPFAIVHDHIYTPLPLPRTINPDLSESTERVLLKALAKDKEDRYSNVSSMIQALKESLTSSSLGSTVKKVKSPNTSISELNGGTIGNSESTAVVKKPAIQQETKQPVSNRKLVLWLVGIMAAALMVTFVVLLVIFLPKLMPADEVLPTLAPTIIITEPAAIVVETPILKQDPTQTDTAVKPVATLPFVMTLDQEKAWNLLIKAVSQLDEGASLQALGNLDRMQKIAGNDIEYYVKAGDNMVSREKWGIAAYLYLNLYRIEGDSLKAEHYDRIAESLYKAGMEPQSALIFTLQTDERPLFQISKARYELYNGSADKSLEILNALTKLPNVDKDFPQVHLVEAEYFIYESHLSDARQVLLKLLERKELALWISGEANNLLSSNNLQ
jgi:serine/threonine protein kinase